jgi:putative methyltransferase (TIGR04325 family)
LRQESGLQRVGISGRGAVDLADRVVPYAGTQQHRWPLATAEEIFSDFDSALTACGRGYNDPDIADVIAFKTAFPIDNKAIASDPAAKSVLSIGIAAAENKNRPLTVLDFGGGCGTHYFAVAAAIRMPLRWAIVETETMAKRAAELAKGRFDVFTDVSEAAKALDRIDVVYAMGSIQYVPDPLATLRELTALRPRHFVLGRFPWWTGTQFVGIQTSALSRNGIGPMPPYIADREIKFPITFANHDDVLRLFDHYECAFVAGSPGRTWDYHIRDQQIPEVTLVFRQSEIPLQHSARE